MDEAVLNAPLYTAAEVGRLVKLSAPRVRRWLHGYEYRYHGEVRQRAPVLRRAASDERFASFLDLMEIKVAKRFMVECGLSLGKVRRAFEEAAVATGYEHPFARSVFYTLGKDIYLQVRDRGEEVGNLLHLFTNGQWAIGPFITQEGKRIDFDPQSLFARRWWPLGKTEPVVLDPAIGFGRATLAKRGVRTLNIYRTYVDEGRRVDAVSRWLKIDQAEVLAAVRWEEYRQSKAA